MLVADEVLEELVRRLLGKEGEAGDGGQAGDEPDENDKDAGARHHA